MTQPREDKYKAKNSIDTFVYRAGDQIGAWSYPLSPGLASVSQEFHLLLHRSRLFGASLVSGWDENKERWPMETETADKFLIRLATIDTWTSSPGTASECFRTWEKSPRIFLKLFAQGRASDSAMSLLAKNTLAG
jgi:hypothetical protein